MKVPLVSFRHSQWRIEINISFPVTEDYSSLSQTLTTNNSLPTNICVALQVCEDDLVEGNETFQLQVTSDDPAILLVEPSTTEITIINTDGTKC